MRMEPGGRIRSGTTNRIVLSGDERDGEAQMARDCAMKSKEDDFSLNFDKEWENIQYGQWSYVKV